MKILKCHSSSVSTGLQMKYAPTYIAIAERATIQSSSLKLIYSGPDANEAEVASTGEIMEQFVHLMAHDGDRWGAHSMRYDCLNCQMLIRDSHSDFLIQR